MPINPENSAAIDRTGNQYVELRNDKAELEVHAKQAYMDRLGIDERSCLLALSELGSQVEGREIPDSELTPRELIDRVRGVRDLGHLLDQLRECTRRMEGCLDEVVRLAGVDLTVCRLELEAYADHRREGGEGFSVWLARALSGKVAPNAPPIPDGLEEAALRHHHRNSNIQFRVFGVDTVLRTIELGNSVGHSVTFEWSARSDGRGYRFEEVEPV